MGMSDYLARLSTANDGGVLGAPHHHKNVSERPQRCTPRSRIIAAIRRRTKAETTAPGLKMAILFCNGDSRIRSGLTSWAGAHRAANPRRCRPAAAQ